MEEEKIEKPVAKKAAAPKKETVVEKETKPTTIAVKMINGLSYKTANGLEFTKDHPYHILSEAEAKVLLEKPKFREATPVEIKQYYGV